MAGHSTKKKTPGPRKSTRGRRNPPADQTSWRKKMQADIIKFDDIQKEIYLAALAETGLRLLSAQAANVRPQTVLNHIEADPEFAKAVEEAQTSYNESICAEVHRRGVHGYNEPVFYKGRRASDMSMDQQGRVAYVNPSTNEIGYFASRDLATAAGHTELAVVPAAVHKYSDRMLEMEAKRVEPAYRDKGTLDLNHKGGVMVAPAAKTPTQWVQDQEKDNETKQRPGEASDK